MSLCNKITVRLLTVKKDDLIKESKEKNFDSLSDYLRFIIDNRQVIGEVKNEARAIN